MQRQSSEVWKFAFDMKGEEGKQRHLHSPVIEDTTMM